MHSLSIFGLACIMYSMRPGSVHCFYRQQLNHSDQYKCRIKTPEYIFFHTCCLPVFFFFLLVQPLGGANVENLKNSTHTGFNIFANIFGKSVKLSEPVNCSTSFKPYKLYSTCICIHTYKHTNVTLQMYQS